MTRSGGEGYRPAGARRRCPVLDGPRAATGHRPSAL